MALQCMSGIACLVNWCTLHKSSQIRLWQFAMVRTIIGEHTSYTFSTWTLLLGLSGHRRLPMLVGSVSVGYVEGYLGMVRLATLAGSVDLGYVVSTFVRCGELVGWVGVPMAAGH